MLFLMLFYTFSPFTSQVTILLGIVLFFVRALALIAGLNLAGMPGT
jgi:hypothetical protein